MTTLTLGYSPCPNDTFLFYALVHGLVDTGGYRFVPVLEDVETLNRWALEGRLGMTKLSYGVLGAVRERYWCLRSGGALGRGCGPLLVARETRPPDSLKHARVAVPGLHTTANLLLGLRLGAAVERVPLVFHEIMTAVQQGAVEAGVVIHEGRFTYGDRGLVCLEDLGVWWEQTTGLPIPLGGIALRRDLPAVDPLAVQAAVRRSVAYALRNPAEPLEYVRRHAQELDAQVVGQHIALYVNSYSEDLGTDGERAVTEVLRRGEEQGLYPPGRAPVFPG